MRVSDINPAHLPTRHRELRLATFLPRPFCKIAAKKTAPAVSQTNGLRDGQAFSKTIERALTAAHEMQLYAVNGFGAAAKSIRNWQFLLRGG